jgi:hypothetical protein
MSALAAVLAYDVAEPDNGTSEVAIAVVIVFALAVALTALVAVLRRRH